MKRWDRLVDAYVEEYRARGIGEATINHTGARLDRSGLWLKQRRPRVPIERIDSLSTGLRRSSTTRRSASEKVKTPRSRNRSDPAAVSAALNRSTASRSCSDPPQGRLTYSCGNREQ